MPQSIGFFRLAVRFQQYAKTVSRHGTLQIVFFRVQLRQHILHRRKPCRHAHGFFIRRVVADVHIGSIMLLQRFLCLVRFFSTKLRKYQPVDIRNIHIVVLRRDGERICKCADRVVIFPHQIVRHTNAVARLDAHAVRLFAARIIRERPFKLQRTLAGVTHADKKEAGAALLTMCQTMLSPEATQIGSYRGLTLELAFDTFAREYRLTMIGQLRHTVTLGTDVFGNLQRMDNALEGLPIKEQTCREQLSNLQTQLETAKVEVQKPFPREEELTTKTARLEELNTLLNLDHKEPEIVDAEPDEDQRPPERRRPQLER